jgi:hypothetical protein
MYKDRKLIFKLTRPIFIWNFFVTLACIPYLYVYGLAVLPLVMLFKFMGYLATAGIVYLFSQNTFYFFRNAGYSIARLFISIVLFDFIIYIALMIILLFIKPWLPRF